MKKIFWAFLLVISTVLYSCRASKRVSTIIRPDDKKETKTEEVKPTVQKVDSVAISQTIFDSLMNSKVDFKTATIKSKMDLVGFDQKIPDITLDIKMIKDSLVWVRGTANFVVAIEAFRALITKDSVKIILKQDKIAIFRSINYLKDITNLPLSLSNLQDLILGNPFLISKVVKPVIEKDNYLSFFMQSGEFKNLSTFDKKNKKLVNLKLDDANPTKIRTANASFSKFENISNNLVSTFSEFNITEKKNINAKIEHKKIEFNKPIEYNFKVPNNYKYE